MKKLILLFLMVLPLLAFSQNKPQQKRVSTQQKSPAKKPTGKTAHSKKEAPVFKEHGELKFFNGKIEDMEDSSRKSGRPYFIFFYTPRDANSREMLEKVLDDSSIIKLVDTAMIAYKIDTYENAYKLGEYQLEDIPALLLYDHNAKEIDRLEGLHKLKEVKKFLLDAFK